MPGAKRQKKDGQRRGKRAQNMRDDVARRKANPKSPPKGRKRDVNVSTTPGRAKQSA
jgi:hypothetical protein